MWMPSLAFYLVCIVGMVSHQTLLAASGQQHVDQHRIVQNHNDPNYSDNGQALETHRVVASNTTQTVSMSESIVDPSSEEPLENSQEQRPNEKSVDQDHPKILLQFNSARLIGQGRASESSETITSRLQKFISASRIPAKTMGLWVSSASQDSRSNASARETASNEVEFELNGQELFIPASLSKLVTAGAILNGLHPTYKYKTQLLSPAHIKDSVLAGSLYLKGGGDPAFVSENMWVLVNDLTRAGITSIDGDIIVDDSRFDDVRIGQDRESVRVDRAYDAPLGAMSMNWNAVNVYIRPGDKAGEAARVILDPDTPYLRLVNKATTAGAGKGKTISVERTSENKFEGDVIRVTGRIAVGLPEVVFYKSITNPILWSGQNLVWFLKQRGIHVRGSVKKGVTPLDAQVVASVDSKPLSLIIADMSKWSNNFVAEMLVKNLAAEAGVLPATMAAGMLQLQKFLDAIGFKRGDYQFINASGFSRGNKMSPRQLGRILEIMRDDFTSFPEFLTSLPIAGVDGTLRSRMKNTGAERWVRAKTGLLNGVVGLAGYAGQPDGTVRSFAFIYNGSGREDQARALFDRMAAVLTED